MPRVSQVPPHRTREKAIIWERYREPVGFKFFGTVKRTRYSEPEHFEYSVITTRRMRPRAMAFLVRNTVRRMIKDRELPPEIDYKAYDNFMRLHGQNWQRVHKVLYYNVQHTRT